MSEEKTLKQNLSNLNIESVKDEGKQVKEIMGKCGREIIASRTGKVYHFAPVSMSMMPDVTKLIAEITEIMTNAPEGTTDADILNNNENGLIDKLAKLIKYGLIEDLSIDDIKNQFSIGDFPKCYEYTLDMNDFLVGMRKVILTRVQTMNN